MIVETTARCEMKVKFSAEIQVPDGTPIDDVEAWLRFELGAVGQLKAGNAMGHTDLASVGCRNVEALEW
jgi:hypothetical protein